MTVVTRKCESLLSVFVELFDTENDQINASITPLQLMRKKLFEADDFDSFVSKFLDAVPE